MNTRAARSDRFGVLFRTHYAAVAGYLAHRAEPDAVDDLVDDVFLVAWRRLDQVPAQALPWLLAVARNVLGTHIRGRRRGRALGVRLALAAADEPARHLPPASGGDDQPRQRPQRSKGPSVPASDRLQHLADPP